MRFTRCVNYVWRRQRLSAGVVPQPLLGVTSIVGRMPALLLVWLFAWSGMACQRGDRPTGEAEAGQTSRSASEQLIQRDTAVGTGDANERREPDPDPGRAPAAEPRSNEKVMEGRSGIEGRVTIGPACPVVEEDRPCPDRPYQAGLSVRRADSGVVVATVTSDAMGLFRLELPPGLYIVDPGVPRLVTEPRAEPVVVEVMTDRFAGVVVKFDSGVR